VWGGTRRPKLCVRRSDLYGYRELYGHKRGKLEFTITKGSWKIYLGTSVSVDLIFFREFCGSSWSQSKHTILCLGSWLHTTGKVEEEEFNLNEYKRCLLLGPLS
jgi:hypothetical protein